MDGRLALTGGWDGVLKLWDARTGAFKTLWKGHDQTVSWAEFSPDGALVVSASYDMTVRLWKTATGECLQIWTGHTGRVNTVTFSPDGLWALSGSDDHTLRLWDVNAAVAEARIKALERAGGK